MNAGDQHRIAKRHLERSAIVYVRQSDPRQVRENAESTFLQRGLREKAIEMGWPMPKLVEDDLGITASGFAEIIARGHVALWPVRSQAPGDPSDNFSLINQRFYERVHCDAGWWS